MSFFTGRVTYSRFKVLGPSTVHFDEDHLERLGQNRAGRQRIASADGVEVGWTAGDHILDTEFDLAKNVINGTLHFELRIDVDKMPGDLLRAYYAVELKALAKGNPSGLPSARQKKEAREIARERIEQEGKDGRFRKQKTVPVLWDSASNEVLFGATSLSHVDRLTSLFGITFGQDLEAITAGRRAYHLAELREQTRSVDSAAPAAFVAGASDDVVWIADEGSRDFLGNEFLLWLWFYADVESDTVKLADNSEATFMLARSISLECPRGQTGADAFAHEGPSRLPEARRAIQSGKLPRKAGLTVVRHGSQYEFALHAETLAIGSAKLPASDENGDRPRVNERVDQIRNLVETTDLLYDAFGRERFGPKWGETLSRMQNWLQRESR